MATGQHGVSAAHIRALIENSPIPMAATSGDRHIVELANSAFCQLASKAPDEVVGHAVGGLLPDGIIELLERALQTGSAVLDEDYVIWSVPSIEGTELLMIQGRISAARDLQTANMQLLIAGLNAQEQAEVARRDLDRLSVLFESLSEGITVVDTTERIVLVNQAATDLLGYSILGTSLFQLPGGDFQTYQTDGRPLAVDAWPTARVLRGEQFDDMEYELLRPDGERRRLAASGRTILDDQGNLMFGIVAHHDVTAQHALEEQKENFLSSVAHDLKSPLAAIQGFAQLLDRRLQRGESLDGDRTREQLALIVATVRGMVSQIDAILARQSVRAGLHGETVRDSEDLAAVVQRVVSLHQEILNKGQMTLDVGPGQFVGPWNGEDLGRVLANFLSNAVKYSLDSRQINVRLSRESGTGGPSVVLSVQDHGRGIPVEELSRIFDWGYRASNVQEISGFGIGLTGVRNIVEGYGGTVSAESDGDGTTMTVRLPL